MKAVILPIKNSVWNFTWLRRVYARLQSNSQRGLMVFVALVFVCLAVLCLFGVLLIQDIVDGAKISRGITIDNRAVGGLTRPQATEVVQKEIATPLNQAVVLYKGETEFTLDPKEMNLKFDIGGMVERAYWMGRSEFLLERMGRRLLGKPLKENVPVMMKYDKAKLEAFVAEIGKDLDYAAKNSSVDMSKGYPHVSTSKDGLKVNQAATVQAIVTALPKNERRIAIVTETVKPKKSEGDIGKIIVIKQGEHKLFLYDGEELVDTYPCAVGTPQYPTPMGTFQIEKKEKNPTWYPPKSDWASDKKPIPPGPGNPLGPYWMEIGNSVGIHSTYDEASIGYSASHGCIRLSEYNAMILFDLVQVGTPVYIMP